MARSAEVVSHWHLLIDDFATSALEFYDSVEAALKDRAIPELQTSRVDWHESGVLSAKREYLRIERGHLTYDICAAPYGNGYFFSSWMAIQPSGSKLLVTMMVLSALLVVLMLFMVKFGLIFGTLLYFIAIAGGAWFLRHEILRGAQAWEDAILAMPLFGFLYRRIFKPVTYYAIDTRLMFQESVHRAVTTTIAGIRAAKGLRALSADEMRPDIRDVLAAP